MYLPKHFSVTENIKIRKLIEQNPFVTIISFSNQSVPTINHLPIILESNSENEFVLIGHMSKNNPQYFDFQKNTNAIVIVHGPHTYITPKWYRSGRDVPTWNYAILHLHGKIELIEKFPEQVEILKKLTHHFEKLNLNPWEFELPEDLAQEEALNAAIVSFRFIVEKIESKFKLSQNRSAADKAGVIDGLQSRIDDMSKKIHEMMIENN